MLNHKRSSNSRVNDAVGIVELIILLVLLPIGMGSIGASIFKFSVWSSILIGLASSIIIFLSLIFLPGATVRFPDHLPEAEDASEV